MMTIRKDFLVGVLVVLFSLFLVVYFIPQFVDSPRAVRSIVLSPVFWPTIIAWMMFFIGVLVLLFGFFSKDAATDEPDDRETVGSYVRILIFGAFLGGYYLLLPIIGMVWSSSLAFIVFSIFISGTAYRKTAIICGFLLPLALYVFFYHIAGVNIPQSELLRLP
ncbi:tripartite tricarboxylate transporter TctB family protein [Synechocystis sp. LEGE 06083]|nr:tripartite tricarboxylate transporter TctB family protein [Synechocystis sp. LEGE 06083]